VPGHRATQKLSGITRLKTAQYYLSPHSSYTVTHGHPCHCQPAHKCLHDVTAVSLVHVSAYLLTSHLTSHVSGNDQLLTSQLASHVSGNDQLLTSHLTSHVSGNDQLLTSHLTSHVSGNDQLLTSHLTSHVSGNDQLLQNVQNLINSKILRISQERRMDSPRIYDT